MAPDCIAQLFAVAHDLQMSLVEDVNTGQQRTGASQPTENGLFEAEAASTKKSSGATSAGGVSNTPPRGTPYR